MSGLQPCSYRTCLAFWTLLARSLAYEDENNVLGNSQDKDAKKRLLDEIQASETIDIGLVI